MDTKTLKLGLLNRTATFGEVVDEKAKRITLSFMSEEPYQRWFGREILSMSGADLTRAEGGTLPFLVNHNTDDQIGIIEKAWTEGSKGKAVVRFGNSKRANEIWDDITETKIRQAISVGYVVNQMDLVEGDTKGGDTYRVTDFEVMEISSVPTPADPTVGIGRAADNYKDHPTMVTRSNIMKKLQDKTLDEMTYEDYHKQDQWTPLQKEENRVLEILALGKMHKRKDAAVEAVENKMSLNKFRDWVLDEIGNEYQNHITPFESSLDYSFQRSGDFSFSKLIASQIPGSGIDAGFEKEVGQEIRQQGGRNYRGFAAPVGKMQQRSMLTDTGPSGGYLVPEELMAGSFIDLLRNKAMVMSLNPTILQSLQGDVAIPKQTGSTTAYFVGENEIVTNSDMTLGQIRMTPKTIAIRTSYSRRFLLQSSLDVEQFVRQDLAANAAVALDWAAINGIGANGEPLGILNAAGIGDVAGGTDGTAPGLSHIIELEADVANSNADVGNLGYLTNSKVRAKLKQTFSNSTYGETPLWTAGKEGFGLLNGYRSAVSNNVPSDLDKGTSTGVCSAIIYGNWSDLIIGFWSGLDVIVDPHTDSDKGQVNVTAFIDFDTAIKHAESFSVMQDALTT